MTTMTYKGYTATAEYDPDAGIFHGEVADTRDVITFQGKSVAEEKQALVDSIEDARSAVGSQTNCFPGNSLCVLIQRGTKTFRTRRRPLGGASTSSSRRRPRVGAPVTASPSVARINSRSAGGNWSGA